MPNTKRRLTTPFWVVLLIIFSAVDLFVTPALMNHTHGLLRMVGFLIGLLTLWPAGMLVYRIIEKIRHYLFLKFPNL